MIAAASAVAPPVPTGPTWGRPGQSNSSSARSPDRVEVGQSTLRRWRNRIDRWIGDGSDGEESVDGRVPADGLVEFALAGIGRALDLDYLRLLVVAADLEAATAYVRPGLKPESPLVTIAEEQLERLVAIPAPASPLGHYRWIDGRYLWLRGRGESAPSTSFGVAAARRTRLSASESALLVEMCHAVANVSFGREPEGLSRAEIARGTTVVLRRDRAKVLAEVTARWEMNDPDLQSLPRRVGLGRSSEPAVAVARGAAKACRPRVEVVHAGVVSQPGAGDRKLAVVLIRDVQGRLRFGWAAREDDDLLLVAEAVFVAAAG